MWPLMLPSCPKAPSEGCMAEPPLLQKTQKIRFLLISPVAFCLPKVRLSQTPPLKGNHCPQTQPFTFHPRLCMVTLHLAHHLGTTDLWVCPGRSDSKEPDCNAGDPGSIPGLGRSPGEGNGYPLQYSCLENPMDREAWWATVHGVTKIPTQLSERHTPWGRKGRR